MASTARLVARNLYIKLLRGSIKNEMDKQRLKLVLWDMWGYRHFFGMEHMSFGKKISLLRRFLKVDWNIEHAHKPNEISKICVAISKRGIRKGDEVFIEAGCFKGGSACKYSLISKIYGYKFQVYDSFEGVEPVGSEASGYDFSGEYVGGEEEVRNNVKRFGDVSNVTFHKGWFKDSMKGMTQPVSIVYIDCDIATGTKDVLENVVHNLPKDGLVFTQDFQVKAVRLYLNDPQSWSQMGVKPPKLEYLAHNTARINFSL